jgi:two-component system sensor histidine kinase CpxA
LNSIFIRTLLWFIVTVFLTFVAMIVAAAVDVDTEDRRPPFGAMLVLQFAEARFAYEAGGPEALRATLERFRRATDTEGVLTDAYARDLATGRDRSDLLAAVGTRPRGPMMMRGGAVLGRRSLDGRYIYFMTVHRGNWFRWFLQPEVHLTVLGVLALLSFLFARHLTDPVKRLQKAVECFGRGEFSTRVKSYRSDEIGQLARTFNQMADRIETLLAAERRLLLDISHELRSPLARLNVAVELARTDEDRDKHLDRIQRDIDRLNALVEELLQVTRAEGDAARMRQETVPLEGLLDELISDVNVEAEARGCRVGWTSREPAKVQVDPVLVRRAIENILRNAVRYAPAETAVEVSLTVSGQDALVAIRDCGPGVPEQDLDRIFDAFYRVESDRNRWSGGVGLGLSIARRAVQLHHGEIHASNANPGLRVVVKLPIQKAA